MDIFLRYQLLEPQKISAAEANARWEYAREGKEALQRMERIVGARDPGVHFGKLYIERVMNAIKPTYAWSGASGKISMPERLQSPRRSRQRPFGDRPRMDYLCKGSEIYAYFN